MECPNTVTPTAMSQIRRYAMTARHLGLGQLQHRAIAVARRRLLHPLSVYRALYVRHGAGAETYRVLRFADSPTDKLDVQQTEAGTFTFLNRTVELGRPLNWFPNEVRLWLYKLHEWHYAMPLAQAVADSDNEQAYALFRRLVLEWIAGCPVATPTAWDAYPMSLRMANWVRVYSLLSQRLESDEVFASQLRRSLFVQACFLEKHLEYDLLNNHLLENGRALVLAGLFFQGRRAERWLKNGMQILSDGLENNFLADGGHDELSPMYHQVMLRLYEEIESVLQRNGHEVPNRLSERLADARDWLGGVCHPDGEIALLNDAAFGVAPQATRDAAEVPPAEDGLRSFDDSGYYTFRDRDNGHFLIFDCGPLGPDHMPGHGHCDALSYELSVSGLRMIVDAGVSTYHGDLAWRNYYRSTRAHNTVVVDGEEQSEIWHRFRVARRAQRLNPSWSDQHPDLLYVSGAHTGYQRLKGKVTHRRWIAWVARRFWIVCDCLSGDGIHSLENFVHFHPDVHVASTPNGTANGTPNGDLGLVRRDDVALTILLWGQQRIATYRGELDPIQGWYAPEFGLDQHSHVWGQQYQGRLPAWMGYVLWPGESAPTVQCSPIGDTSYRVHVQSDSNIYDVRFDQQRVTLERST